MHAAGTRPGKTVVHRWSPDEGWDPPLPEGAPSDDPERTLVVAFGDVRGTGAGEALRDVGERLGGAVVVGCTTAGAVSGTELVDEGLVAAVTRFEGVRVASARTSLDACGGSEDAGRRLAAELLRVGGPTFVLVLSDGLAVNGASLARGLAAAVPSGVPVLGGLAGDGDRFERTTLWMGDGKVERGVVAVGFYGERLRVGCGVGGGWDPYGPKRRVTRSRENVVFELDGEPALDLYERYLGPEAQRLPASGLLFPMEVLAPEGREPVVRTLLGVDREARSLTFAGDVPPGSVARLMKTNMDRLIEAAQEAGRRAASDLGGTPDAAFFVSCVGRRLVLGQRVEEEAESVAEALGGAPSLAGFYSYGELAPLRSGDSGCALHNQTMTVVALREA